jgi:hypothetical protein
MTLATRMMECSGATVEIMYPGYRGLPGTTQKSGYDLFPQAANGWETMHHVSDMAPQFLPEEEGPPT